MTDFIQQEINYREFANSLREELLAAAREAQAAAYAPYSNFSVGAAVLLSDGTIYRGCNISDGRIDIAAVAVVTSAPKLCKPCGACRQVIAEFSQADNPIAVLSASLTRESSMETISDLLPDTFTLL